MAGNLGILSSLFEYDLLSDLMQIYVLRDRNKTYDNNIIQGDSGGPLIAKGEHKEAGQKWTQVWHLIL